MNNTKSALIREYFQINRMDIKRFYHIVITSYVEDMPKAVMDLAKTVQRRYLLKLFKIEESFVGALTQEMLRMECNLDKKRKFLCHSRGDC